MDGKQKVEADSDEGSTDNRMISSSARVKLSCSWPLQPWLQPDHSLPRRARTLAPIEGLSSILNLCYICTFMCNLSVDNAYMERRQFFLLSFVSFFGFPA